jgi:aldehyde:ferredoxin oxidoreductase
MTHDFEKMFTEYYHLWDDQGKPETSTTANSD